MGTGRRSRQRAVGAAALPEPGGRARLGRVPGPVVPPVGGSSSPGGAGGGGRGPRFRPGSVPTAGLAPTGSAGPALRDTARRHGGAVCLLSPAHRAAACAQLKAAGVGAVYMSLLEKRNRNVSLGFDRFSSAERVCNFCLGVP